MKTNNENKKNKSKTLKIVIALLVLIAVIVLIVSLIMSQSNGKNETTDKPSSYSSSKVPDEIEDNEKDGSFYVSQSNVNSGGFIAQDDNNTYIATTYGICYCKNSDKDKPFDDYFTLFSDNNLYYNPNLIADNKGNIYYMTSDPESHKAEFVCYNIEEKTYKKLFNGNIGQVIMYDDGFYYTMTDYSDYLKICEYKDGETTELFRRRDQGLGGDIYAADGLLYFVYCPDDGYNELCIFNLKERTSVNSPEDIHPATITVNDNKVYYIDNDASRIGYYDMKTNETIILSELPEQGYSERLKMNDNDLWFVFSDSSYENRLHYKYSVSNNKFSNELNNACSSNIIDGKLFFLLDNGEEYDRRWIIKEYSGDPEQSITVEDAKYLSDIYHKSDSYKTNEDDKYFYFESTDDYSFTVTVDKFSGVIDVY